MSIIAGEGAIGVVGEKPLGVIYGEQLVADFVDIAKLSPGAGIDRSVITRQENRLRDALCDEHGIPRDVEEITDEELSEIGGLSLDIFQSQYAIREAQEALYSRTSKADKLFSEKGFRRMVAVEALVEGTEPIDALGSDHRGSVLVPKRRLDKVAGIAIMPNFDKKLLLLTPPKRGWLRVVPDISQYSVHVLNKKAEPLVRISFLG